MRIRPYMLFVFLGFLWLIGVWDVHYKNIFGIRLVALMVPENVIACSWPPFDCMHLGGQKAKVFKSLSGN